MTTAKLPQTQASKLWLAAIKPPIYTVAIMPIIVGTAVAFAETKVFYPGRFWTFLMGAILLIAWMNLSNDVFDAETGIDKNKPHSVVNLTGKKTLIFWLSNCCLLLGMLAIGVISWWQKDWTVLELIVLANSLAYTYQGPPFRFGYQGWGEIICVLCFSIATLAACYSQGATFSTMSWAAATIIGLSTAIILFCSHFHQVEDDLAAGKLSPIVRLGTARGSQVLTGFCGVILLLILLYILLGYFPRQTLISFISVPFAYQLVRHVHLYRDMPEKVSNLKFIAVNLHFTSGILLALGFLI